MKDAWLKRASTVAVKPKRKSNKANFIIAFLFNSILALSLFVVYIMYVSFFAL
jgi:hypothetical protein